MRSILKVASIQAAVFLALLLVTEGAVRVLRPDILPQNLDADLFDPFAYAETYGYKSRAQGNEFGAVYVTDEYGFRINPNMMLPADPHRTVLVLGDSVSVGIGVAADEAYPFVLQQMLPHQRVVNASVTGYGMKDYRQVLEKVAGTVRPDMVMIGWCLNDLAETSQAAIVAMTQKSTTPSTGAPDPTRYPNPMVRWLRSVNDRYLRFNDVLKAYSRTYLLLKSVATDSSRDYFTADGVRYADPGMVDLLTSEFVRLRALTERHKSSMVVVVFPYEYQLRAPNEASREPQAIIQQAAIKAGVKIYDLFDDLLNSLEDRQISSRSLYLFNDPMHFNARGHHLIAELLDAKLAGRR